MADVADGERSLPWIEARRVHLALVTSQGAPKKGVDEGKHEKMTPKELHQSRDENHQNFTLGVSPSHLPRKGL